MTGGRWRVTAPLLAVIAADSLATGLILPVLPFLARDLGASAFVVGALFAAYGIAQFCAAPLWGTLADRVPIRPLICAAAAVTAGGHLVFAVSSAVPVLMAGRIVAGLGAGTVLMAQTYIAARTTTAERSAAFGRISAVQGFGTIVGPLLGAVLVPYGHLWVGLAAAAMSLAAGLTAFSLPGDGRERVRRGPSPAALRVVVRTREVWALAGVFLAGWLAFAGYSAVLPLHLQTRLHLTTREYQLIVVVSGFVALVARGAVIGAAVKRLGQRRTIVLGAAVLASAMVVAPLLPSAGWTPLLPVLYAGGAGLLFPSVMSLITAVSPSEVTGSVLAGASMLGTAGRVAGPLLLTAVAGADGGSAVPFLLGAALLVAGAVPVLRARPVEPVPDEAEAAS